MTAMTTQRSGLEAFRKSWICGDCGGSNAVAVRECEDCGQVRGTSAPRTAQSFALNNQGNGSVVNNVLVVGGDMAAGREVYHIAQQEEEPEPAPAPRYAYQAPAPYYPPAPYQLTSGSSGLAKGAEVAKWVSAFIIVPIAFFFIWFIYAGIQQILRVVPH
jgi:hypothetical protein